MSTPYTPPPPPQYTPPPPPTGSGSSDTIDFAKCFSFVFQDPDWIKKVLIGGLCYIGIFFLIGIPFLLGYMARLMRNVMAGMERPLPDWDDIGGYFAEGIRLLVIPIVYMIPVILIYGMAFGGALLAGHGGRAVGTIAGCAGSAGMCLAVLFAFAAAIIIPAALTLAIADQNLASGFQFGRIFGYIKANLLNYVLAWVIHFLANFAAQFGIILLCIGIAFTAFWSMTVGTFAYGETYRLRKAE